MFNILTLCFLMHSFLSSQTQDYDSTGMYAHDFRTEDIPGYYETMNDSRIYYPDSNGVIPQSAIPCPIIIFGHGYLMGIDRYYSLAEHLASWGYIVVLPTISNPFPSPEHYTRAYSMVDAARWTAALNETSGDPFFGDLDAWSWGFSGHSMGGGLALLAADTFNLQDTLKATVAIASPQTTPATNSADLIIPKMIICGSIDNIAPWNDVRTAFWHNTPAPGTFAVIDGANHGYFMDYSYSWENGGTATINREEQLRITRRHLTAYFEHYLHDDTTSWNFHYCYGDSIKGHPTMDTVEVRYQPPGIEEGKPLNASQLSVSPNPVRRICAFSGYEGNVYIYDATGAMVDQTPSPGLWQPDPDLPHGIYFAISPGRTKTTKLILLP